MIGSNGDDPRKIAVERLPRCRATPAYLDFGKYLALKALDQHEIARTDIAVNFREWQLWLVTKLAHQGKAPRRGEGNLVRAGFTQLEGVAAGMIDVETFMRMFDDGNGKAACAELPNEICHESGLARVLPSNHAEERRAHRACSFSSISALASSSGSLILKNGSINTPPISVLGKYTSMDPSPSANRPTFRFSRLRKSSMAEASVIGQSPITGCTPSSDRATRSESSCLRSFRKRLTRSRGKNGVSLATVTACLAPARFALIHSRPAWMPARGPAKPGIRSATTGS